MKSITLYRMVGFTNSTYMDGNREVGWTGDFCETREEAGESGCGANGMESGSEVREYTLEDHGDEWKVFVDGEIGTLKVHDIVVDAAIALGLATAEGLKT